MKLTVRCVPDKSTPSSDRELFEADFDFDLPDSVAGLCGVDLAL